MVTQGTKALFWVMATLVIAIVPQLLHMQPALVMFTLAPIVWRTLAELRGWGPVPSLVKHGMTAAALLTLFFTYGNLAGRRSAVSLLTVMLGLKLMECYRVRDARVQVCFSLFLAATQFLFTQGIIMPFYGLAVVSCALVALSQLQRIEAWPKGNAPAIGKVSTSAEVRYSLRLMALALPVALAFFILFPRLASPLWGIPEQTLDSKTGLSDSMSPGSIQQLFMDDSPAFRVTFEDSADLSPSELYWRGPVFWDFDGRTWSAAYLSQNIEPDAPEEAGEAARRYSVMLEPNERKWLFSLDHPIKAPAESRLTMDYQIIRRAPVLQLTEYELVSNPNHMDSPELLATFRDMATYLPDGYNPETLAMMERWRAETPDDVQLIQRVLDHFNTEPFHYTLDAPPLGRHSVDEFLFTTREGFCEHYASTFAVMMRMAGIPSRVVTGYLGGWYSELGDYLLVRQSDAHAWTELWLPRQGWVRFDPTSAVSPTRVREGSFSALSSPRHFLDYSWFRSVRNSIDIVQQRWNDWVIDYGAERQASLFSPLGLKHMSPPLLIGILGVIATVIGVVIAPFVLRVRGPGPRDPLQQTWVRFLNRLRKAGYQPRPSMGPNELAISAAAFLPQMAPEIERIGGLYSRIRYAPDPPSLEELKLAVKEFHPKNRSD